MKKLRVKKLKELIIIIRAFNPSFIRIGHSAFYQNGETGHNDYIENVSDLNDKELMDKLILYYDYTEERAKDSVEEMKKSSCSVGEVSSGISFGMSFVNEVGNDIEAIVDYVDFQSFFVRRGE